MRPEFEIQNFLSQRVILWKWKNTDMKFDAKLTILHLFLIFPYILITLSTYPNLYFLVSQLSLEMFSLTENLHSALLSFKSLISKFSGSLLIFFAGLSLSILKHSERKIKTLE